MKTRPAFDDAASAGIITAEQARALSAFYATRPGGAVSFDLAHVLWYAGALVVIGAMGLFSTLAFGMMGGPALTATALIYAAAFVAAGRHLRIAHDLPVPGGLLIACAVAMTPLAVYGLQESWGWGEQGRPGAYRDVFTWIKGGWVPMEAATLVASAIALRATRFGFITLIAAVALWFLSMDIGLWATGPDLDWETRRTISLWFGLALIAFAWAVDLRQKRTDYAFWLHLSGILTFWGALTWQSSDSEVAKALYALLNVALIGLAIFLSRRIYAVFGAIGVALYLGDLANRVFRDSLLFPFALSLIGLGLIGLGILYQRHADRIGGTMMRSLPGSLRRWRPDHGDRA
ncbi:hypothetical protein [Methylobacterium bullatum]|uniref:DUF2157 domain-containing protein n=1 Tax=Methylobacterium bullatum TaxID=570505 RepID=A0AAV4Z8A9_9HYPH|nr:hypothetical protein [Methylobacterium bullatum]MBD8903939.1 hypothetical protein [Methylobacterium bullatum]GJD39779.1 hypothetical protein OICFNHDK_2243 [Methylobacterium bullatum]